VISQSWGDPELDIAAAGMSGFIHMMQAHRVYMLAAMMQITLFASVGGWGAANFGPYDSPLYPASDPFVTAVGGTNLFMNCPGGYSEGTGNWTNRKSPGLIYNYEIAGNDYGGMVADGYPSPSDLVTAGGAMSGVRFFFQ
jgi:subtilase family serine protease